MDIVESGSFLDFDLIVHLVKKWDDDLFVEAAILIFHNSVVAEILVLLFEY